MSRLESPILMPFGAWQPDLPEWRNPGAITAKGVVPRNGFYAPLQKPVVFTSALTGGVSAAVATVRSIDGLVFNYAATGTKLFEMTAALGWTDRTRLVGGDYTTISPDRFEFAQFGETLIAVNGWTDDPQAISLGGSNFDALSGSAPRARHIAIVGSFVVLGNVLDGVDGSRTHRLWWSAFDDASDWVPSLTTQCSFRDLVGSGGSIRRIIGGEYGTVFREKGITRMSYIGPPGVFQLDDIEDSQGIFAPYSAVKWGTVSFYLSSDGWYAFDGARSVPIGRDKLDKTFFNDFLTSYSQNVVGGISPASKVIHWIYPGAGAVGGVPNRLLLLDPASQRFALSDMTSEYVAPLYTSGALTTDAVDAIFANTDAVVGFLDDPQWSGGDLQLGFFDSSHRLNFLAGNTFAAQIDTGERQINPMGRMFINGVQFLGDAPDGVTITMLERNTPYDSVTTGESDTLDSDGEAHPRSDARFHRVRVDIAEDTLWTKAEGVAITEAEASGQS